jgi:integrase
MPKRAKSEGSIYQRKDGRWVVQVSVKMSGQLKRISRYAATQQEARRLLTAIKRKQDTGAPVLLDKSTLGQWLDEWLLTFIGPHRSPATSQSYRSILSLHIPLEVKNLPVSEVRAEHLQRVFNRLTAAGKHSTADQLRRVVRSAFSRALKLGRIERNPVTGTDPPKFARLSGRVLTAQQAAALIESAEVAGDPLAPMWAICLFLGLRRSEVVALKAEDIDLASRRVHVRRSLIWKPGNKTGQSGEFVEAPCKTEKSRRSLPLFGPVLRMLACQIALRASQGWKGDYLFVTGHCTAYHPTNISHYWRQACRRAGVPLVRLHDARHSCGTLLHGSGASPFVIQEVLGHTQLSTTRRYTHVPDSLVEDALGKVAEAMRQAVSVPRRDEQTLLEVRPS